LDTAAIVVGSHLGIRHPGREHTVDNSQVIEDFERTRLKAFSLGADSGLFETLDQKCLNAVPVEFAGECQTSRASSDD
jgi:hypothetical protein